MTGPALLEVEDLRTSFRTERGEARAVDGVSFRIGDGEVLGLVGESGCGKTVTGLSILGLVESPPGRVHRGSSVRLRGEELVGASARRMRSVRGGEIAMIFQEPGAALNPVLTVGRQVTEALTAHRPLPARQARRRAVELLDEVGIPDAARRADGYPHELSGGMRQRVVIAMALAGEPDLLVADEPTTALDVTIQAQILELLDRVRRERGMSLLLITHDLGVVAGMADRVAVMYAGRIVETAPTAGIFREPLHPYTRALLDSVPVPGAGRGRLRPVEGEVPDPAAWPRGCRFRPRCPHAWERCLDEPGLLSRVAEREGGERAARCWLVEEPERGAEAGGAAEGGGRRKPGKPNPGRAP